MSVTNLSMSVTKLIWYIELVVAEVATPWRNHANNQSQQGDLEENRHFIQGKLVSSKTIVRDPSSGVKGLKNGPNTR